MSRQDIHVEFVVLKTINRLKHMYLLEALVYELESILSYLVLDQENCYCNTPIILKKGCRNKIDELP